MSSAARKGYTPPMAFLPALPRELPSKGSADPGELDAIFVTGDAYVDHPSFGVALLARLLESEGYRIGVIARPDPDDVAAFRLLGKPRLAFLVASGAVDSMVSSYTASNKPRSEDDYAPGGRRELCLRGDGSLGLGKAGRQNARPDRALIAYTAKCREAYKGAAVVIGGLEASLRRLAHYDYWSDKVRRSILLDSKADLLVYGMGETALVEIMSRLSEAASRGEEASRAAQGIRGLRGTVWRVGRREELGLLAGGGKEAAIELPPPSRGSRPTRRPTPSPSASSTGRPIPRAATPSWRSARAASSSRRRRPSPSTAASSTASTSCPTSAAPIPCTTS